ncbi:unnamed protein product, partial [marine sediment metagenome]
LQPGFEIEEKVPVKTNTTIPVPPVGMKDDLDR